MAEADVIEVFRTRNQMAARTAVDEVLEPLGIEGFIHDRNMHALPAPASMPGGYFVAVPGERAAEAAEALREAITDGAIDGEVIADAVA